MAALAVDRLRVLPGRRAGVEVADDGAQAHDPLAREVDDEPEDAVRRGMVGAEIDLEDVLRVAEVRRDLEDRGGRRGNSRPLVDPRARSDRHYSSPLNRTGSPPSG